MIACLWATFAICPTSVSIAAAEAPVQRRAYLIGTRVTGEMQHFRERCLR